MKEQAQQTAQEALEHGKQVAQESAQSASEGVKQAAGQVKETAQQTAQTHAAPDIGVEIVVGAETAGVRLAAAISLSAELPFAFVGKPGYRGHEIDEPPVRGADVAGRRRTT